MCFVGKYIAPQSKANPNSMLIYDLCQQQYSTHKKTENWCEERRMKLKIIRALIPAFYATPKKNETK